MAGVAINTKKDKDSEHIYCKLDLPEDLLLKVTKKKMMQEVRVPLDKACRR